MISTRKPLATLGVALFAAGLAVTSAGPANAAPASAAAAATISIDPAQQSVANGGRASWIGRASTGGPSVTNISVSFGDGTSTRTSGNIFQVRHVFYTCTARSTTYTQRWAATNADGARATTTSTVTVSYTGPLCV